MLWVQMPHSPYFGVRWSDVWLGGYFLIWSDFIPEDLRELFEIRHGNFKIAPEKWHRSTVVCRVTLRSGYLIS